MKGNVFKNTLPFMCNVTGLSRNFWLTRLRLTGLRLRKHASCWWRAAPGQGGENHQDPVWGRRLRNKAPPLLPVHSGFGDDLDKSFNKIAFICLEKEKKNLIWGSLVFLLPKKWSLLTFFFFKLNTFSQQLFIVCLIYTKVELGADESMLKEMQTGSHSAGEEEDK